MNRIQPLISSACLAIAVIASSVLGSSYNNTVFAQESEFASATVDMGIVVKDADKSVKFYTEALGFTEIDGFSVPGDFCKAAGLTDGQPLDIRVVVLDKDDEKSTKIKLMQLPGVKSKKSDNSHIHSQLGFSYLTIFVEDTNAAIARLTKAKAKPIAKGPVGLPKPLPAGVFLTVVRDPDGNLIELVGPKK
ncbi:MAG: bleomycin resistance protein [Blastopirellula sp.]|nr:MAG: bleomycin resistance protein [Blastopirellula sp.]